MGTVTPTSAAAEMLGTTMLKKEPVIRIAHKNIEINKICFHEKILNILSPKTVYEKILKNCKQMFAFLKSI
jgi:hypothetical protein